MKGAPTLYQVHMYVTHTTKRLVIYNALMRCGMLAATLRNRTRNIVVPTVYANNANINTYMRVHGDRATDGGRKWEKGLPTEEGSQSDEG